MNLYIRLFNQRTRSKHIAVEEEEEEEATKNNTLNYQKNIHIFLLKRNKKNKF